MARSDLLLSLVKASAQGDQNLVRRTVESIVAEEKSKAHFGLANRLLAALDGTAGKKSSTPQYGKTSMGLSDDISQFLSEQTPRRDLDDLFLPTLVRDACSELIEEQMRSDLLRAHAIEPRSRVLLVGPPGNGKTTLAEAIAYGIGVPFYTVRYDGVIGSFLGETASRLKNVFDFVRRGPCVIFFDEFDAIGKERGDVHETGEIKRVVSSLLVQIDELPTYNIVIAATNHAELIDRAAWRRFQLRLELPLPGKRQICEWIEQFASEAGEPLGRPTDELAKELTGLSYAEVEQFFLDVKRQWVLSMGAQSLAKVIAKRLSLWHHRVGPKLSRATKRNDKPSSSRSPKADEGGENYSLPGFSEDQ